MVLEILALAGVPTAIATCEGIHHQNHKDSARDEHWRMRDFHIVVFCNAKSRKRDEVDKKMVVLRDGKLYLSKTQDQISRSEGHPFTGFYLDFPRKAPQDGMFERLNKPAPIRGLVSTISDDPPTLQWIYADTRSGALRHGSGDEAAGQLAGPWDWTDDEVGLTLEGWEGFVAVEEEGERGTWRLYYDRNDDGLRGVVGRGRRVLRCSLERKVLDDDDDEEDVIRQ